MASVIVAGARTPFGKFGGAFKEVPATSLGAHAIRAALDRSGIEGKDVDYVIMGQVLQAGAGQITARQTAIGPASRRKSPRAGGMESMSEAPYLFPKARFGARMGDTAMVDSNGP